MKSTMVGASRLICAAEDVAPLARFERSTAAAAAMDRGMAPDHIGRDFERAPAGDAYRDDSLKCIEIAAPARASIKRGAQLVAYCRWSKTFSFASIFWASATALSSWSLTLAVISSSSAADMLFA